MFKTFASALLAAGALAATESNFGEASVVRGKNDGTDNENANYCDMIANDGKGVKVDLFTYIKRENKVAEWHGETKLYLKDVLYPSSASPTIRYGFCMQMTEAKAAEGDVAEVKETWDCSSVDVEVTMSTDGNKVEQNTTTQFKNNKDWQFTGAGSELVWSDTLGTKLVADKKKDGDNEVESADAVATHNF